LFKLIGGEQSEMCLIYALPVTVALQWNYTAVTFRCRNLRMPH